jgi:hypothetical protein
MSSQQDDQGYQSDDGEGHPAGGQPGLGNISSGAAEVADDPAPREHFRPVVLEKGLVDVRSQCLESTSPAHHWAKTLIPFVDDRRLSSGLADQCRDITMLSLCTGMYSEGIVAEVPWRCCQ